MTEAELQRLAAIINGMSDKQASISFDYWQVVGAVAAGVLINGLTGLAAYFIKDFSTRRQNLRDSRKRLYRALVEYRSLLGKVPGPSDSQEGMAFWKENAKKHTAVWAKIDAALNSGNDAKYAEVINEELWLTVYLNERGKIPVLDRLIERLEPQVLSATERTFDKQWKKMG